MRLIVLLCAALLSWSAAAAIDTYRFNSVEQEQQYRELTEQLRCPKCQNNSIADSNAIIAADMRTKVYELMMQGQSKQQIIDYMVARYGNFVTYEPPVTPATLILWIGPLLFVLIGGGGGDPAHPSQARRGGGRCILRTGTAAPGGAVARD
ncbi:Cytochrome c-type biogenesis protein CcmH precursor [Serratia marcescens]|uniref:Cytochrome c-type biogenesis protein n=1 Tax=Serratia marcescens TaxID=615 RepID=A0A379YZT5_SERMA|nr:Cytochrome c-type biogenesis protein CcmH precursor [Serratia marcescens]